MTKLKSRHGALPAALMIAAGLYAQAGAQPPTMVLSPGKKLAFDFSSSPNGGSESPQPDELQQLLDEAPVARSKAPKANLNSADRSTFMADSPEMSRLPARVITDRVSDEHWCPEGQARPRLLFRTPWRPEPAPSPSRRRAP